MGEPGGFILRRIKRDDPDSSMALSDGGRRATSFGIRAKPDELGSSWTHEETTTARQLLDQVRLDGQNPDDYYVCRVPVAEVIRHGVLVHDCPTDIDPGHCEIRPNGPTRIPDRVWSKIAKKTRILSEDEVGEVQQIAPESDAQRPWYSFDWLLRLFGK
jgi:hypothetical protein